MLMYYKSLDLICQKKKEKTQKDRNFPLRKMIDL